MKKIEKRQDIRVKGVRFYNREATRFSLTTQIDLGPTCTLGLLLFRRDY